DAWLESERVRPHLEARPALCFAGHVQAAFERFVDDDFERPSRPPHLAFGPRGDVLLQRQRGPHEDIMMSATDDGKIPSGRSRLVKKSARTTAGKTALFQSD